MKKTIVYIFFCCLANMAFAQRTTTISEINLQRYMTEMMPLRNSLSLDKLKQLLVSNPDNFFQDPAVQSSFGLSGSSYFLLEKSMEDFLGANHYRYQQYYLGVPIKGAEIVLHEITGQPLKGSGKYFQDHYFSSQKKTEKSGKELEKIAESLFKNMELNKGKSAKTQFEEEYWIVEGNQLIPAAKYFVKSDELGGDSQNYLLNKKDGTLILNTPGSMCGWGPLRYLSGQGAFATESYGSQNCISEEFINEWGDTITCCHIQPEFLHHYYLKDEGRDIHTKWYDGADIVDDDYVNEVEGECEWIGDDDHWTESWQKNGVTVHWGVSRAYDYFDFDFGHQSFDGNGSINVDNYVDIIFDGGNANNAFYSPDGDNLLFGLGGVFPSSGPFISIDLIGHEYTHGITHHSSDLEYAGESGALNESFSDIFGVMLEYAVDQDNPDYFHGEDFWIPNGKFRDMSDPNMGGVPEGQPDTYGQNGYWFPTVGCTPEPENDFCGVHINSCVQNYWFYLLAEGGTGINANGDAYDVQAIGRTKAAKIAFLNVTQYLTSTSNFGNARDGSILAAEQCFGLCSFEFDQTIAAWEAVGVESAGGIAPDPTVLNCTVVNNTHNAGNDAEYFAQLIESDCSISDNPALVSFRATYQVHLTPNFSSGPNFHAYIDDCFDGLVGDQPDMAYRAHWVTDADMQEETAQLRTNDAASQFSGSVFPNPTNGDLTMQLELPTRTTGSLQLYDLQGRAVKNFFTQQSLPQGSQQFNYSINDLSPGMYMLIFKSNGIQYSERIVLY